MSTNTVYDGDLSGVNPDFFEKDEPHVIAEISEKTNNVLIPNFPPFFPNNFSIGTRDTAGVFSPLREKEDFEFVYPFYSLEKETGKIVYTGVQILKPIASPMLYVSYQRLGGKFQTSRKVLLENLATYVWSPRLIQFDQLTDIQETFPPNQHQQNMNTLKGWDAVEDQIVKLITLAGQPMEPTLLYQQAVLDLLKSNAELTKAYGDAISDLDDLKRRINILERRL